MHELSAEKETNYSLWNITKKLKRPIVNTPPLRKLDGTWARSNKDKADHLESVFQPSPGEELDPGTSQESSREDKAMKAVTFKDVKKEIQSLNVKKSPGFDLISAQILKELPYKGIMKITHHINAVLRLKYVPED